MQLHIKPSNMSVLVLVYKLQEGKFIGGRKEMFYMDTLFGECQYRELCGDRGSTSLHMCSLITIVFKEEVHIL